MVLGNRSSSLIGSVHDVYLSLLVGVSLGLVCVVWSVVSNEKVVVRGVEADKLELWWTVVPGLVLGVLCSCTVRGLYVVSVSGGGNSVVSVVGRQWYWEVSGVDSRLVGNSVRLSNSSQPLFIHTGDSVVVSTTSGDVIHSLSVTGCGMKLDCVPGRVSSGRLGVCVDGVYSGFCSELCGSGHGMMPISVVGFNRNSSSFVMLDECIVDGNSDETP